MSSDHFSVDGTLIEAWASMKSFRPKDGSGDEPPPGSGRNAEVDFKGEKRSNETHASTTDPEAKLYRKGAGMEAKLARTGPGCLNSFPQKISGFLPGSFVSWRRDVGCDAGRA
jgi:hypothetical protein